MRNAWNYGYYFNGKKDDGVNDLSTLLDEGKIRCDWETGASLKSLSPEQKQGTKEATHMLLAADHKEDQDTSEPTQTALMCWLFAKQMQIGDIIFAREAKTQDYIYGVITGNYHYDENRPQFKHSRSINWLSQKPVTVAEVKYLITKALTYIKWPETVETLTTALNIDMNKLPEIKPDISTGSPKKDPTNVIFYGPPGTGKTYKTKEHAIKVCRGDGNYLRGRETIDFQDLLKNGQVEFTTFHQSYDYADFVVGFKPETIGETMVFKPKPGLLLRLAKRARENPTQQYLLIMDEINRGNISKIFGELITLIEADKRADGDFPLNVTLPCSCPDYLNGENHDQFSLPSNIHFLGTMNTADRSIALLDTALRRRFHFEEMKPNPDKLSENYDGINLRVLLTKLNIMLRDKLTRDHQIGHAWFPINTSNTNNQKADDIVEILNQKILPIIDEWFYDDLESKKEVLKDLAVQDSNETDRFLVKEKILEITLKNKILNTRIQIKVPEFGEIKVSEHGGIDSLSYVEAEKLVQISEEYGCTKSLEWFRFRNRNQFKAGGWVGVINLGRVQITVYPKINGDREIDLIKLLIGAGWIEDETYGHAKLETQSNFIEVFADWYARRLQREATHGLPHNYVNQMDSLGTLRGRLNLNRQIMAIARGQATLECDFDTFEADTVLNQTLKAGLRAALNLSYDPALRKRLRFTMNLLDNVSDKVITIEQANQIKLRRNEIKTFQPLLSLAKIFLQGKSPKVQGDEKGSQAFGLMFSMWRLFEEYGLNTINKSLSKIVDPSGAKYFAKGQEKERYLGTYFEKDDIKNAFQIKPDIIIYKKSDTKSKPVPVYIADTKWKDLDDGKSDSTLGVKPQDAYQLFVYSNIYTKRNTKPLPLALLYPTVGNINGDLPSNSSPDNLLGALGKPKRIFYLDSEKEDAIDENKLDGIPLHIFDFPLPTL